MKPPIFLSRAKVSATIGMLFAAVSLPVSAAQVAASIEYEPIPTPTAATLPAGAHYEMRDMQAPKGTHLSYLSIKAIDGFRMPAALWTPDGKTPADTTMIISVPGSAGNFSEGPSHILPRDLTPKGYAVLAINTRQSDDAVNTDNFYETSLDIDAAVRTAKALGYRRLVIHGQSLGTVQVQYYAATHWDPEIKGIILSGAFGNLPWKSHYLLVQDEDDYRRLRAAAHDALKAGRASENMPIKMKYLGGEQVAVSARHFLTYRDDLSAGANSTYWIGKVPYPIIVLRSQSDIIVNAFEPHMLVGAARAEGSLVPAIEFHLIPDPQHPHGAPGGHGFQYNSEAFTAAIYQWLQGRHL